MQNLSLDAVILLDENSKLSVKLRLLKENDAIILRCNDDESVLCTDILTSNSTFQLFKDNPTKIAFHVSGQDRFFLLKNNKDIDLIIQFLNKHFNLEPIDDGRTFWLKDIPKNNSNNISKFLDLFKHTKYQPSINVHQRPVDAFMLWTIDANIPNCSMKTLTKEDIETMNLSTIKLSTTEIPKVLYPLLLQKIINPDPNFDSDYAQLKKQWESTTEGQWRHHFKLREFVACIEKWIQKPHLKTEYHKKLFFNLSMTMFTHYFGEFPPTSQFISMVKTIFQAFLTDDADENGFKFVDGSKLTFDQTEVFLFKYVRDAWTIISKDKYDPKKDFMCVRATLLNLSPSTFEVINDHGVDSFDFFKADCDSFYAKCRTQEDRLLMFVAMLLSGNLTQFKQTIIAIASVLGHEQLHLIPVNDTQCFCQMFCNIFRHIDTRLLLHNYEKIQMSL